MNRFQLLIFSVILILFKNAIGDELKWDYSKLGPDVWGKYFPDCNGDTQSPINIKTECTVQKPFESFSLSPNFYDKMNFTLRNDGHTITSTNNGPIVTLTGGDLNGNFVFKNFHLHWGPDENVGSEHQV
jgi:carbonic anhydrase